MTMKLASYLILSSEPCCAASLLLYSEESLLSALCVYMRPCLLPSLGLLVITLKESHMALGFHKDMLLQAAAADAS